MTNYSFLDAAASVTTAASSTIGGVEYPIVYAEQRAKTITSISGTVTTTATQGTSISGTVDVADLQGHSISGTVITSPTQGTSISGTVDIADLQGHSISGTVITAPTQGTSISGTVDVDNFPTNQSISGTVITAAVQGTSISGTVDVADLQGHSISGTVITAPTQGTSVSGTVISTQIAGSILATSAVVTPADNQSVSGSVGIEGEPTVLQLAGSTLAVSGSFSPAGNQSVSGTVFAKQVAGSILAAETTNPAGSVGAVLATQGTDPWTVSTDVASVFSYQEAASIQAITGTVTVTALQGHSISGTVTTAAVQGTSISGTVDVAGLQGHSISGTVITAAVQGTSISGTVGAIQTGTARPSTIGYLTRNDAVASFLGADLAYRPGASDAAGRTVNKPFAPEEARIEGYVSTTNTSITELVAAAGAGLRNYITDLWVANTGSVTTLVTLKGGASVLGYTVAPATGGSNLPGLSTPIRTPANAEFVIQAGAFTSTLYATVKGYKAP